MYFLATVIISTIISCDKDIVEPKTFNNRNGISDNRTIQHNGLERSYIIYIPTTYTGNTPVPLILNFHGHGSSAFSQMNYGDMRPIADMAGFIIVHPQATVMYGDTHWNVDIELNSDVDDIDFLDTLLDSVQNEFNIDAKRIYSTGYSNGARMSFLLGCKLNHRIAAVSGVAGLMSEVNQTQCSQLYHPTPVLQIHGTNDSIISYQGTKEFLRFWVSANNCNEDPIIWNIPDINLNDGISLQYTIFRNMDNGINVEHIKVNGGGHHWPGYNGYSDLNASSEIWKFLSRYDINGFIDSSILHPNNQINP